LKFLEIPRNSLLLYSWLATVKSWPILKIQKLAPLEKSEKFKTQIFSDFNLRNVKTKGIQL
jgi:hypothetical protein